MKPIIGLPATILAAILISGTALAQDSSTDQVEEVAPPSESLNIETMPEGVPATTGSIVPDEEPAAADDDVPDENRSISGKVQEEIEGAIND